MDLRQFIAEYRMKQIREWLSFTDKSMTEIAQIYGFKSLSAFSHFVERRMKETPVGYRRQHRPANYAQLYEWE
jgi:AraC-like DNA-binding protein